MILEDKAAEYACMHVHMRMCLYCIYMYMYIHASYIH